MSQNDPLVLAQREWVKIFNGGAYTGMLMMEQLIKASGKTHKQFLEDPKNSIKKATETHLNTANLQQLGPTWNTYSGRCTSFAVKAINELNAHKGAGGAAIFNFEIYDLSRHRVARCKTTGIVIDSSSTLPNGAFVLPEGEWARFPETDASWKFKSSESKFERQGNVDGQIKKSSSPITSAAAMLVCLKEVEESAFKSVPTLFRSVQDGIPMFHGIIVWCPREHALELGANATDWKDEKKLTIQFPKYLKDTKTPDPAMVGTLDSLRECLTDLNAFIRDYGGPHGKEQWANIEDLNTTLIQNALDLWGFPKPVRLGS
ncbi:hypothetical protein B0T26DRAFT_754727 [Lasiosphaeria miniovina]|uniref:Uncharacterized protein n=1 Tax=Lasiosphaeria miniovina TaxID=1954250 RepID=A0AA40A5B6_9PEZI|nr:uncharacterized protein B0T26DRAFT_754727 [Lasiosphaeria miniovina]KAK0709540.1 hypothetical protein B0T26DRAFT_754727 [Lasiosphaeria miniovina]